MSFDNKIDQVRRLAKNGESQAAFALIKELISGVPDESKLWMLQGSLYAKNGNYEEAIRSLDTAIGLSPQGKFYFHRGRYNFALNKISQAAIDFDNALDRDNYNDITFTQEIYFYRAEALIRLGKKKEALSDLSHIPDDYQTWIARPRNKADLIADCNDL